jgi:hypothetical protein
MEVWLHSCDPLDAAALSSATKDAASSTQMMTRAAFRRMTMLGLSSGRLWSRTAILHMAQKMVSQHKKRFHHPS